MFGPGLIEDLALEAAHEAQIAKVAIWGSLAGKARLAKRLVAMIPEGVTKYCEPFFGAGSVFWTFCEGRDVTPEAWLNDYETDIAEALKILKGMRPSDFARLKAMDWTGRKTTFHKVYDSRPTTALAKLHRFLYVARFSYGSMRKRSFDPGSEGKTGKMAERAERFAPRLANAHLYQGDYERVMVDADSRETFHFLDPPYAGYNAAVHESEFDEERFFARLKALKGKFVLTYGIRGKLPAMVKGHEGFSVRTITPPRSIRTRRGVAWPKVLPTLVVTNFDATFKAAAVDEIFRSEGYEVGVWTEKTDADLDKVEAGSVCAIIPIRGALKGQFPRSNQPDVAPGDRMPPHVTVLFQSDPKAAEVPKIKAAIERAAAKVQQFEMQIGGLGHFHGDEHSVAYAKVAGDGVQALRRAIELELQSEGIEAETHKDGFTPHATIQYIEAGSEWDGAVPSGTSVVKTIEVWTSEGRTVYSLSAPAAKRDRVEIKIDTIVNGADGVVLPCAKAADEQYVLGIVLKPEETDTQGDIYDEDAIRKAAFGYMASFSNGSGRLGLQHKMRLHEQVVLVESYLAPVDFTVGGREIKKGTWLMGWLVKSENLWQEIKAGKWTGFSIGGTARKTPVKEAPDA